MAHAEEERQQANNGGDGRTNDGTAGPGARVTIIGRCAALTRWAARARDRRWRRRRRRGDSGRGEHEHRGGWRRGRRSDGDTHEGAARRGRPYRSVDRGGRARGGRAARGRDGRRDEDRAALDEQRNVGRRDAAAGRRGEVGLVCILRGGVELARGEGELGDHGHETQL
eukprot:7390688-Prymnesium_polylepis.1